MRVFHIRRKMTKIVLLLVLLILPVNDIDCTFRRSVLWFKNTNSILRNVQLVRYNGPHFGRQAKFYDQFRLILNNIIYISHFYRRTVW